MPEDCLACETPLAGAHVPCPHCGFPPELTGAAVIGLGREGFNPPVEPASTAPAAAPESAAFARDPEDEAIGHFARELHRSAGLIRDLGGEVEESLGEARHAALLQTEGRASDALSVLRESQVAATTRVAELFEVRLHEIEERQHLLIEQGFTEEIHDRALALRAEFAESPVEAAAEHLAALDRELLALESSWADLRALLRQLDQTRAAANKLGHELPELDGQIAQVRARLARTGLTAEDVATAAEATNRVLTAFQEQLAPRLQGELDQHAHRLSRLAPDLPAGERARRVHAEANRHLRYGRLAEASFRLAELREAIAELSNVPPAAAPAPRGAPSLGIGGPAPAAKTPPLSAPPASGPSPAPDDPLPKLLARARELAGRIKSLPADSPLAQEAAGQIRVATEQLRARDLDAAGRTLTELMRSLDETRPSAGGGA